MTATRLHTGAGYQFELATHYSAHSGKLPVVVIVAGWKSSSFSQSYAELAQSLRDIGYHTLQLSLRGHEGSLGGIDTVTRADHIRDFHAAYKWLHERPEVDKRHFAVAAASYGAYIMACMAPEFRPISLMLLRAPALYPNDGWDRPVAELVAREDRVEWRKTVHNERDSEALRAMSQYRGDLLFVTSEHDEDMPSEVIESYKSVTDRLPHSRLHVELAGATHSLSDEAKLKFRAVATAWFREHHPQKQLTPAA